MSKWSAVHPGREPADEPGERLRIESLGRIRLGQGQLRPVQLSSMEPADRAVPEKTRLVELGLGSGSGAPSELQVHDQPTPDVLERDRRHPVAGGGRVGEVIGGRPDVLVALPRPPPRPRRAASHRPPCVGRTPRRSGSSGTGRACARGSRRGKRFDRATRNPLMLSVAAYPMGGRRGRVSDPAHAMRRLSE